VRQPVRHLFLFIGADPNTDWLAGSGVALDPKGFILTGAEVDTERKSLETSRPGLFAVGDVRSGSVKRVAAAAGEGAQVVATLHGVFASAVVRPVRSGRELDAGAQRLIKARDPSVPDTRRGIREPGLASRCHPARGLR
jgi:thioredoxin reductase (NADPH)